MMIYRLRSSPLYAFQLATSIIDIFLYFCYIPLIPLLYSSVPSPNCPSGGAGAAGTDSNARGRGRASQLCYHASRDLLYCPLVCRCNCVPKVGSAAKFSCSAYCIYTPRPHTAQPEQPVESLSLSLDYKGSGDLQQHINAASGQIPVVVRVQPIIYCRHTR